MTSKRLTVALCRGIDMLKFWNYKGLTVYPADRNSSGIRWYCRTGSGRTLRADTKATMRDLITIYLGR